MKIIDAIYDLLSKTSPGIVTDYTLFSALTRLYADRSYNNEPLRLKSREITGKRYHSIRSTLLKSRRMRRHPDFLRGVYELPGSQRHAVEEICCFTDPFCYVSHLSAMQRHRLTNRNPKTLALSSPEQKIWRQKKYEKIESEFSNADLAQFAADLMRKYKFMERINGLKVERHHTRYPGETIAIRDSFARISSIGQTFLDMVTNPKLCGGTGHTLEVWQEHADLFQEEIISTVSLSESKIAKVRAGYILDELLNISDTRIQEWTSCAQRGSSRKLDPQRPFVPTFSKKWMISLNV